MAPNEQTLADSYLKTNAIHIVKTSEFSTTCLLKTISDVSFELLIKESNTTINKALPAIISEIEDALCECCGLIEECTPHYIHQVQDTFLGKLVCGLCAEAVKEEMGKNGGKTEEALKEHMSECISFNRICRAYPVLCQAEVMREILKKKKKKKKNSSSSAKGGNRLIMNQVKGGMSRTSSYIPAISGEIGGRSMVN